MICIEFDGGYNQSLQQNSACQVLVIMLECGRWDMVHGSGTRRHESYWR